MATRTWTRLRQREGGFPGLRRKDLPVTGVFESLWWGDVHIWRYRLVHKGPKANPKVASNPAHLGSQLGTQGLDARQIILHGEGQVHQVVDVYRVILHLPHLK